MRRKRNPIPKVHIKKEDNVKVIAGNDKGKTGRVLEVIAKERKATVEGVNVRTVHTKPTAQNPHGGIQKMEKPINISKLMVVDPKTGEPTRIGRTRNEKGKWVRYSKKSDEIID